MKSEIAIELKNVTKFYNIEKKIFENLTISFPKKCIIGLVGENGSGKTTFIKMISGMTKQNSGEIYILNDIIKDEKTTIGTRNYISILGDANRALYWNLTGMDNIEYFWTLKTGKSSVCIPEHILNYIQRFKMTSFINNKVEAYSKGMKQRLLLLISLLNEPQILFMDEPLNGLDYENAIILKQMINIYCQESEGTVFITSHDQNFLNEVCDLQLEIKNKIITERETKDKVCKMIVYFIKTNTPKCYDIFVDKYMGKPTEEDDKTVRVCADLNDAEFYQTISEMIYHKEIVILEADGL